MVGMDYGEVQGDTCIVERPLHSLWSAQGPASMVDFAETKVKTWTLFSMTRPEHDALRLLRCKCMLELCLVVLR